MADAGTVVHLVSTLEGGGVERTLVRLLSGLPRRGLRHRLVALRAAGALAAQLPDHISCLALDARGRSVTAGLRAARRIPRDNVRLIHARGIGAWADAVLMRLLHPRARVILGFHGLDAPEPIGPSVLRRITIASRLATRVASPAESSRNLLIRLGVPAHRIDVLPNGVDTARFSPASADRRRALRAALGWAEDRCVAVCVASLTPVKGHDLLLRAAETLRNGRSPVEFVVIGDGPLRQRLETDARHRGLSDTISFLGSRDDVPDLLRAADMLVCPSRTESMCNAVLEGLASGLPVIAADVGDNRLLLDHGSAGLIVPPEDPTALARAIQTVVTDEPQRRAFGRAARQRAAAFSDDAMIARYDAYYHSLLGPAPVTLLKARTSEACPSSRIPAPTPAGCHASLDAPS